MFKTYFSIEQLTFLVPGFVLLALSTLFFLQARKKTALTILSLSALCFFLFAALLDPFLNTWDERFHALVAKNLLANPWQPSLYPELLIPLEYRWDRAYIWLHKQPLFLYQIALSFKIFGVNEMALRIPSALLCAFAVPMVYRSGKILVNDRVGFLAAVLWATSFYLIEMISGRQGMDHNDIAFVFYVSASIWACLEYLQSKNKAWLLLIAIFSACAILCKWLVGLLVYWFWGIYKILQSKLKLKEYFDFIIALAITCLLVLPWQIYIFKQFPFEALFEYEFNTRHFTEVLSGHSGDWWFHFGKIKALFGSVVYYLFPLLWIVLFWGIKDRKLKWATLSVPFIVYLFFSLAQTKIQGFTFVIAMMVFIAIANLLEAIIKGILSKKIETNDWLFKVVFCLVVVAMAYFNINIENRQAIHTKWKKDRTSEILKVNADIFKSWSNLLKEDAVVFNIPGRFYVDAMFYNDCVAYNFIPTMEQYQLVKSAGRQIAVLRMKAEMKTAMPAFLTDDPEIVWLDDHVYKHE